MMEEISATNRTLILPDRRVNRSGWFTIDPFGTWFFEITTVS